MCDCEKCNECKYYLEYKKKIDYIAKRSKIRKEQRLSKGMCVVCGKEPVCEIDGKKLTLCSECNKKQKNASSKYYKTKIKK